MSSNLNNNMNIENTNFSNTTGSTQYSNTLPNSQYTSSNTTTTLPTTQTTYTTQTAQPFSQQHQHGLKEDTNDLSKPSFFKNAVGAVSSNTNAQMNSNSATSILSNEMGGRMQPSNIGAGVVRDALSLSDIEQRGGLHSGLASSTASHEVLSTLKNKENNVLLGAANKIHDLQQKEHAEMGNLRANQQNSIADIQRKEHENIAAITREKENKIAELKREEAAKIAEIQKREQMEINKLQTQQQSKLTGANSSEKKIHDIAVDAKQKLDQVRATESKVTQNLSAADQLRAMAHEREVLAEKQNAESIVAQSAANALHPTLAKTNTKHAANTTTVPSTSSTTASKLEQNRPIVQQTTTTQTTVQQPGDKFTRGA